MIQRIQTLHLLIVTALMAVTLFAPLAWDAGEFRLYAFSLQTSAGEAVQSTVYMGVVLALACVLPFITIFLFKRRLLQIRLCVVEIVLLIGSAVMEAAYYFLSWRVFSELSFHTQGFRPAIALPLVCLLFAYLAARAVFRDELMVRAADRIRRTWHQSARPLNISRLRDIFFCACRSRPAVERHSLAFDLKRIYRKLGNSFIPV